MIRRLLTSLFAAAALAGCATVPPPVAGPVEVGIIAINDFHGALEPPKQSVPLPDGEGGTLPVPAGGAAWLASAVDSIRGKYANSITVAAGDLIGGSALVSALFLDEPAIGALNRIGLDFNAVGNHEFDKGREELLRMQTGGCVQHTARKPCQVEPFAGAKFQQLAANTITESGKTLFPATALKSFGSGANKVTVGLIGVTLEATGGLVSPEGIKGLTFADEAETVNALVPGLKAQGADAIVLMIHQGGRTSGVPNPNGCENLSDEIVPILEALDTRVDVVVSGHTHWSYICDYAKYNPAKPFLLTSAGVWGEQVTDIRLSIDPVSNRVVAKSAANIIVQSEPYMASRGLVPINPLVPAFTPRPDVSDYVAKYAAAAKEFSARPVGKVGQSAFKTTGTLSNTGGPLGNLIADAQLAATLGAGAQIALMNPFGIRSDLIAAADGSVTFGDLYKVQPFNNELVTKSYTGAELKAILEQGFDSTGPEQVLAPSQGLEFSYDRKRPEGQRIVSLTFNGQPIDPAATYRVTASNFLASGGDTFTLFAKGRDAVIGIADIAALEAWLQAVPPRAVPQEARARDVTTP